MTSSLTLLLCDFTNNKAEIKHQSNINKTKIPYSENWSLKDEIKSSFKP